MKITPRKLTTIALAMLGSLVAHQIAYLVATWLPAGPLTEVDHGHISGQQLLVAPLAVLASAVFIVSRVRRLGLTRNLNARWLTCLSAVLFVGQEVIELVLAGHSPLAAATHLPVPLGLLLIPAVVRLLLFTVGRAEQLIRLLMPVDVVPPTLTRRVVARPLLYVDRRRWKVSPTRGPPVLS